MIRSGLHYLTSTTPLSTKIAVSAVRPTAIVLSTKYPIERWFSTNPKRRENEIPLNNDSESTTNESLEVHKKPRQGPVRYNGPVFRSLFRGFDDDFFSPSFFGRDPFAAFHRDPFLPFRRDRFFDDFMSPLPTQARTDENLTMPKTLLRSSPGYQIKESSDTYEISVDIPKGMKASDMKIELEEDGGVLHLSGGRKVEEEGVVAESWFDKRFSIGPNVDTEKLSANLHDNMLIMSAPKLQVEEVEKPKHTIPITEKPHITKEELVETNYSDAFDESDWAETGKGAAIKSEQK